MPDDPRQDPQTPFPPCRTGLREGMQFSLRGVFVVLTVMAGLLSLYISVGRWLGMSASEVVTRVAVLLFFSSPLLPVWCMGLSLAIRRRDRQPRTARLAKTAFTGLILTALLMPLPYMVIMQGQITSRWSGAWAGMVVYAVGLFYACLSAVWWVFIVKALFGQHRQEVVIPADLNSGGNPLRRPEGEVAVEHEEQEKEIANQRWTEAQFGDMQWHDNHVHAIRMVEGEHGRGELILDLDYILEWLADACPAETLQFRLSPVHLRFTEVADLRISLDYQSPNASLGPFSIDGIERQFEVREQYTAQLWRIGLNWPAGAITFEANGYEQIGWGRPVIRDRQYLLPEERVGV